MDADLLIVGAGPAGLATAIHGALRGLSTIVIDRQDGTLDKACGEGLMPGAVAQLEAMGASPAESHPFHGVVYTDGVREAEGRFRHGTGLGVRRLHLHRALAERAAALGVRRVQARAGAVTQDAHGVSVAGLRGRWLVAADGLRSPIRRQLGLERPPRRTPRVGVRRHFAVRPRRPMVEVHWSEHAEAYVTPVGPNNVGVAFLTFSDRPAPSGEGSRFDRLLAEFPSLQAWLAHAEPSSAVRGAGPFERRVKRRVAGRVLLVGDAAGYLDPLTGEGLRLGFAAADAAVSCLVRDAPEAYDAAWRRIARRYWILTGGLLAIAARPLLRRQIVRVSHAIPPVMSVSIGLLAEGEAHARALPRPSLPSSVATRS